MLPHIQYQYGSLFCIISLHKQLNTPHSHRHPHCKHCTNCLDPEDPAVLEIPPGGQAQHRPAGWFWQRQMAAHSTHSCTAKQPDSRHREPSPMLTTTSPNSLNSPGPAAGLAPSCQIPGPMTKRRDRGQTRKHWCPAREREECSKDAKD